MRTGYIYKLSWATTEHYYIGQTINLAARRREHFLKFRKGIHHNKRLMAIAKVHGLPRLTVIDRCPIESINATEEKYLINAKDDQYCCNIYFKAASASGYKWSDEKKHRQSILIRERFANGFKVSVKCGKDNHFFGRKHSQDSLRRMRDAKKGKRLGGDNPKAIIVLNTETGIFYECIKHAAQTTIYNPMYLVRMLSGDRRNKTSFIYA